MRLAQAQLLLRSEEHTSELQSRLHLVCRLLLEKKKTANAPVSTASTSTSTARPPAKSAKPGPWLAVGTRRPRRRRPPTSPPRPSPTSTNTRAQRYAVAVGGSVRGSNPGEGARCRGVSQAPPVGGDVARVPQRHAQRVALPLLRDRHGGRLFFFLKDPRPADFPPLPLAVALPV